MIEPKDFRLNTNSELTGFNKIPGSWYGDKANSESVASYGYATYRAIIKLKNPGHYQIQMLKVLSAYKLWINNELVVVNGVVGKDINSTSPRFSPQIADFNSSNKVIEVVVNVANFTHPHSGIVESPKFGTAKVIQARREFKITIDMFLCGTLLIMCLYHLGLFALRSKNPSTLFFSGYIFIILIRILIVSGDKHFIFLFSWLGWESIYKISYLTFYLGVPLFLMFISSLFPDQFSNAILRIFQIVAVGASLLVCLSPVFVYHRSLIFYEVITGIAILYSIYVLSRASLDGKEGAIIILVGFLFFSMTVVNDMLSTNRVIFTEAYVPFGLFLFIFAQSFVLSLRFSRAFTENETLFVQLDNANSKLLSFYKRDTQIVEDEKGKWARSLHDNSINDLGTIQRILNSNQQEIDYKNILDLTISAESSIRAVIYDLSPPLLRSAGLAFCLRQYIERKNKNETVSFKMYDFENINRYQYQVEITYFRIAQCAIENILKHSKTDSAEVTLSKFDDVLSLQIEDRGIGFDPKLSYDGHGLLFMRERARQIGADLTIDSHPNSGTTIILEIGSVEIIDKQLRYDKKN